MTGSRTPWLLAAAEGRHGSGRPRAGRHGGPRRPSPADPGGSGPSALPAGRAADAESLFPTFEGELELAALGTRLCQLSLLGSYRPPLSVLGDAGDALFGRRVAELVVRRFVLAVGERIREATLAA